MKAFEGYCNNSCTLVMLLKLINELNEPIKTKMIYRFLENTIGGITDENFKANYHFRSAVFIAYYRLRNGHE